MSLGPKMPTVLALTAFSLIAMADNAALTTGGLPRMMSEHSSIAMASEVVKLTVHGERVDTDCTFVFENHGPACNVKMGFPDFGMWAYAVKQDKASTIFKKFQSYVDGKPVPTKLELGKEPGEQWQTKSVSFDKNGSRVVREVYSTDVGGIDNKIVMGAASYVLHTGASWRGPIGSAKVIITFAPETEVKSPLDIVMLNPKRKSGPDVMNHVTKPGGMIVIAPVTPKTDGLSLVFEETNWKPKKDDDIYVLYRFPQKVLDEMRKKYDERQRGSGH